MFLHFRPHMSTQLLHYQATVTEMANSFDITAWRPYDAVFRQLQAANPTLRWDRLDDNIFNRCFRLLPARSITSTPRSSVCYSCHESGHFAAQCPRSARSSASPSSTSYRGGASSSTSPFRFPQRSAGIRACYSYNYRGSCDRSNCSWEHRCLRCKGDHPRYMCKR